MQAMTDSIVVTEDDWNTVVRHFDRQNERMAFAFANISSSDGERQFLVRRIDLPGDAEYRSQNPFGISLKAEHVVPRVMKAREYGVFFDMHSHPFTTHPSPSGTDEIGAAVQLRILHDLSPGVVLVRMVFGQHGAVWAEVVGGEARQDLAAIDRIVVLGPTRLQIVRPVNAVPQVVHEVRLHDLRTAAVLGHESVASVRGLHLVVIGAGGVGSSIIAQLRGYVDDIAIIDPDVVEPHNAPRLYHYIDGDVGLPKVQMHEREVRRSFPGCRVRVLRAAFPTPESLELFKQADVIFCAPDDNVVRYAAATAGTRYMKPIIEVGCGGKHVDGRIVALGYHVRLQVPGEACLACNGLDVSQLEDPESSAMKRRAGYVEGGDLVAGELMPLTTRAAADAVELFFRYVTGYTARVPRHLYCDALRLQMLDLTDAYAPNPACTLCGSGETRIVGMGDTLTAEQELLRPGRVDEPRQDNMDMAS